MKMESFSFLIKPVSADCNLACEYCFYRSKSALYAKTVRHRMDDQVLAKLIAECMSFAGNHVSFGWQGGEPLLAGLDFFKRAVVYQQRFGRPGQTVSNGFQTNATLIDDDWAQFFKNYNFLVGVSLDGPSEIHNFHRYTGTGRPSYDRVMESIDILKRHGVEFNILTLLSERNISKAEELYDFFADRGMRYLQFIPCIEQDPVTKQPAGFSVTPEQYGRFLCDLFDRWTADGLPSTYIRLFDALLTAYAGAGQPLCEFQEKCGGYVVVEHNGDVYACDFFVEPEWFLGNLMKTPLAQIIHGAKFASFSERKSKHAQTCRQCRWLSICHGGCPKHRTVIGNGVEHPSYFCQGYKTFFEYSHPRFLDLVRRIAK